MATMNSTLNPHLYTSKGGYSPKNIYVKHLFLYHLIDCFPLISVNLHICYSNHEYDYWPSRSGVVYILGYVWQSVYVCMYVCQMITFEGPDVGSSYLHIRCISSENGSSSYMKVVESRSMSQEQKCRKSASLQCKIRSPITLGSIKKIEPWALCVSLGFWLWRIEWCDRHLCHVTGSDHR